MRLLVAGFPLLVAGFRLLVAGFPLLMADLRLLVAGFPLLVAACGWFSAAGGWFAAAGGSWWLQLTPLGGWMVIGLGIIAALSRRSTTTAFQILDLPPPPLDMDLGPRRRVFKVLFTNTPPPNVLCPSVEPTGPVPFPSNADMPLALGHFSCLHFTLRLLFTASCHSFVASSSLIVDSSSLHYFFSSLIRRLVFCDRRFVFSDSAFWHHVFYIGHIDLECNHNYGSISS